MLPDSLEQSLEKGRNAVKGWVDSIGDWFGSVAGKQSRPESVESYDDDDLHSLFEQCLDAETVVTERDKAAELGNLYRNSSRDQRLNILQQLVKQSLDPNELHRKLQRFQADPENSDSYQELMEAATSPRVEMLKKLNTLPSGFKFLVELRSDLLKFSDDHPELSVLDVDLCRLLEMWFDVDLLSFRRITWDSPASLLEKLIDYEDVHRITSWSDLKNRLDQDRRCYALVHPKMPEEPLIFVEIALTQGVTASIPELLDEDQPVLEPEETDTAVFYSISSTQPGLKGISFGNFLLKRVIEDLQDSLSNLDRYVTLSPVPFFKRWLREQVENHSQWVHEQLRSGERSELAGDSDGSSSERLKQELFDGSNPEQFDTVKQSLQDLLAYYLLSVRREDRLPEDPVARFHLRNGARVEQINWMGNPSDQGMKESLGMMVNYRYSLNFLEPNHQLLMEQHTVPSRDAIRDRAEQITPLPDHH